jgi:hypothetical protein
VARTFQTPRRPTRTTLSDCRIRGGEWVEYDRANLTTALAVWLATAQAGDAEAQTVVGEIYEKGIGTAPDYTRAVEWYRKASDQGYARALFNLGTLYEQGLGVEKDTLQALNLYRDAGGLKGDLGFEEGYRQELERQRAELQQSIDERDRQIDALEHQVDELERKLETQTVRRRRKPLNRRLAPAGAARVDRDGADPLDALPAVAPAGHASVPGRRGGTQPQQRLPRRRDSSPGWSGRYSRWSSQPEPSADRTAADAIATRGARARPEGRRIQRRRRRRGRRRDAGALNDLNGAPGLRRARHACAPAAVKRVLVARER